MSLEDGDFDMQPLSRVKYVYATDWGTSHRVMQKRPALAAKAMECIAHWTEIEVQIGMFLAFMLHANEKAVRAIYIGLENRTAQLRMIESAASSVLPQEHADIVSVIMKVLIRPAMRYRDKLAHWCWGFSEEVPDALLIRDPENHLSGFAQSLRQQAAKQPPTSAADHNKIFVVRDGDLDRYLKQLLDVEWHLLRAMASVWVSNPEAMRAQYLQELSNAPQLQAGLVKLRKGRQNSPDTPPPAPPPDQSGGA